MILFRADANEEIGSGHVMRCLTIANEYNNRGIDCAFVTADYDSDTLIENYRLKRYCLNSDWKCLNMELHIFEELIMVKKPNIIIIDHYYVTEEYMSKLQALCRVAYIDDLDVNTWPVEFLIDYNIYAESLDYLSRYQGSNTRLLLGPRYVPLRDEFQQIEERKTKEKVTDVLISTGGADPVNLTYKIIRTLQCEYRFLDITFHVIVGALNSHRAELEDITAKSENILIHSNVQRMELLMRQCDVAIAAAGSTLYELCGCGIPTITYVLADNQIKGANGFEEAGLMINAGDCRRYNDFATHLLGELCALIHAHDKRQKMSKKMKFLVDGHGAERIVDILLTCN